MSEKTSVPPKSDADTVAYFDDLVPEYDAGRLERAAEFINAHGGPESSLVDIGCGAGNTLAYLDERTRVGQFAAIDVSANCLEKTRERVECEIFQGSAVDPEFAATLAGRFDFAIVAAVLHHLVGNTRSQSRQNAIDGVRNALTMLKPGGHLIIHEPVFGPKPLMGAVFWAKRGLSKVAGNRRVPVLGYWGNLGAPVVSYYNPPELERMVERDAGGRIVERWVEPHRMDPPLNALMSRADSTLAVTRA